MKPEITYQGRSLFFNALFIVVNLLGLTSVVMGFHPYFIDYQILFLLIGFVLLSVSIFGIIIFKGRLMMSNVSRVIVGSLCIISGLVKANDPLGFSYKLEEYFEDGALAYRIKEIFNSPSFSLEYLIDYALIFSVLICIIEIVLGVLLIIGGRIKIVAYASLLMMLFFTFLTWHTANCDVNKKYLDQDTYSLSSEIAKIKIKESKKNRQIQIVSKSDGKLVVNEMKQPQCVSDCGCFGDALKGSIGRSLTPNESFWKDLILVYLVIWIFITQWKIKSNSWKNNVWFLSISLIIIVFLSWVFGWYFPIIFSIMVLLGGLWMRQVGGKYLGNASGSVIFISIISALFITYVLMYEPLKDYRPYAVGNNMLQKMYDGKDGKYESELVYKNIKTGKKRLYVSSSKEYSDSKIWENKNWKYLTMHQKVIIEPKLPSITEQFNPFIAIKDVSNSEMKIPLIKRIVQNKSSNEDISIRDYIVHSKQIIILSCRKIAEANWSNISRIKDVFNKSRSLNISFIMITNSSRGQIDQFRKKYAFNIPTFVNDEIELKAISRANPTVLVIKNAIIKGKYPHRSIPKFEWLAKNILFKK